MAYPPSLGDPLSRREKQVAIALLFCRTLGETATDLGISQRTVETYRMHIYRKIGVQNEVGAILEMMRGNVK